jgi:hypothetical protein
MARAGEIVGGTVSSLSESSVQTRGWRSLYYGKKETALSFAVEVASTLPVRFITVLAPAEIELMGLDGSGVKLRSAEGKLVTAINPANAQRTFCDAVP